jgi:pimeloyl-ACP methyl ester carboxylesterase
MRRTPLVLAAAAAGGLALSRRRADDTPWPVLEPQQTTVVAEDGTTLHAEVFGPDDPTGTVVFAHGYVLSNRLWDLQVAALTDARPDLRVVTYDQRGHGRSARAPQGSATIEQLGRDLRAVLDQLGTGPAAVVGHSMGGMTIMSYVEQYPHDVGSRLVAAGLVATSGGGLAEVAWGLPPRVADRIRAALPSAMERNRRWEDAGRRPIPQPFLRPLLFGRGTGPTAVRKTLEVYLGNSAHTAADFFQTFPPHDRLAALAALNEVPVTILVGTEDRICPLAHSRALADALPHARLRVYPGAGHMVQLERPTDVTAELVALTAAALPIAAGSAAIPIAAGSAATEPRTAARRAG